MSLKQRLLFFVAILLAIAIALLSALSYQRMRSEIILGVQQELDAAIAGNSEALGRWMAQRRDAIQSTANRLAEVDASAPYPFLQQGKEAGGFDQTFAGYTDKAMRYHTPDKLPGDGYDPTARPWYQLATAQKGVAITAPYAFVEKQALGITVAIFGARHFVYRRSAEPLLRQWLRFNLLYISAALLHGLVLYLWSDLAGLDYRLGFLLATLLQVVISYWGNKRLVFA